MVMPGPMRNAPRTAWTPSATAVRGPWSRARGNVAIRRGSTAGAGFVKSSRAARPSMDGKRTTP